ncbi:hypothetical protein BZA05DRAFT_150874 [Tricharina praecox]|uniref:uncharacterized protein n=1 Tax=Tricharina praecox TaxID=43433 RepID=UPI0022206530|nr:uncharacterized protein BZA05DRAFT_150874 [Tricharina praecox]KAI5844825.1 hypothetical protein BZA05DRAFT_150874 [Tricharina praecox]
MKDSPQDSAVLVQLETSTAIPSREFDLHGNMLCLTGNDFAPREQGHHSERIACSRCCSAIDATFHSRILNRMVSSMPILRDSFTTHFSNHSLRLRTVLRLHFWSRSLRLRPILRPISRTVHSGCSTVLCVLFSRDTGFRQLPKAIDDGRKYVRLMSFCSPALLQCSALPVRPLEFDVGDSIPLGNADTLSTGLAPTMKASVPLSSNRHRHSTFCNTIGAHRRSGAISFQDGKSSDSDDHRCGRVCHHAQLTTSASSYASPAATPSHPRIYASLPAVAFPLLRKRRYHYE